MNTLFFDDINSYYDLNLILQPFEIPPAEPKTNYIEIPGADGDIDLTEALGDVKYKCRSASAVFSVLPSDDWEQKKSEVSNLLNGRKCKIRKSSDPDWYFEGRCSVKGYKCDKFMRTITVDMRLQPYKLKNEQTVIVIKNKTAISHENHILINSRMPAIPTLTFETNDSYIELNGVMGTFKAGTYRLPEACLFEGDNLLTYYSPVKGSLTITYQEGSL